MERYLIDTNILVQLATELDFTEDVRYILTYSGARIYVSSASVQEFINLLQNEVVKLQKQLTAYPLRSSQKEVVV